MPASPSPFHLTRRRSVEWWALLNAHVRPSDMPPGDNEADAFHFLANFIPRSDRLAFWNGPFRHGLARRDYQ